MSTIKHPVGPQSSKVYWRRRLVVGLGLLIVLALLIMVISFLVRAIAGPDDPGSTPIPTPTATVGADTGTGSGAGSERMNAAAVDPAADPKQYFLS